MNAADTALFCLFSLDKVNAIFNTNFIGTLRTVKGVLPSMREHKTGTIVNISSSITFAPMPALGIYTATKSAVEGTVLSVFFSAPPTASLPVTTLYATIYTRRPDAPTPQERLC